MSTSQKRSNSLSICQLELVELRSNTFLVIEHELVVVQQTNGLDHQTGMCKEGDLISSILQLDSHSNFQGVEVPIVDLDLDFFYAVVVE